MSDAVKIIEVGPRDGLQNERQLLSVEDKVSLVNALSESGLSHIEAGSFVSARWVPQMASSDKVLKSIQRVQGVTYSALTPNIKGYESALASGSDEVAVFTAASESFTQKNINCSIEESIQRFLPIIESAKKDNIKVRAYLSCILGCPYEGEVDHARVVELSNKLLEIGCYEVSLGDTIGVGAPGKTKKLLKDLANHAPIEQLACHFHDTYGQAIANQYVALELGYRTFDTSIAGLGGCPYAKGASGNVSTEDTVYMLESSGMKTGIDMNKLLKASQYISNTLTRTTQSKVSAALS